MWSVSLYVTVIFSVYFLVIGNVIFTAKRFPPFNWIACRVGFCFIIGKPQPWRWTLYEHCARASSCWSFGASFVRYQWRFGNVPYSQMRGGKRRSTGLYSSMLALICLHWYRWIDRVRLSIGTTNVWTGQQFHYERFRTLVIFANPTVTCQSLLLHWYLVISRSINYCLKSEWRDRRAYLLLEDRKFCPVARLLPFVFLNIEWIFIFGIVQSTYANSMFKLKINIHSI